MKSLKNFLIILFIPFFLISCSKDKIKESIIEEKSLDLQVLDAYKVGIESLKSGDVLFAAKKFNEAEMLYPQSIWAPKSALMAAYSYYAQDYYVEAIGELERFLKVYPNNENIDYAFYLLATSYYETIVDEKKDLESIMNARKYFNVLIKNYPSTSYAIDANFKINLINDILASKEVYLGRYYLEKKKWIPAINRFKTVVNNYETTIYVEEALHRLVEIHYILGLKQEAEKYAKLLGYNYQSSEWYEKTYIVFNKMYKINKLAKKDKNFIQKIRSLFN
tara:strand:- start:2720 stop:3553 length:834 start_codon:yes stop_codon:yes gene_type:complete